MLTAAENSASKAEIIAFSSSVQVTTVTICKIWSPKA